MILAVMLGFLVSAIGGTRLIRRGDHWRMNGD